MFAIYFEGLVWWGTYLGIQRRNELVGGLIGPENLDSRKTLDL